MQDTVGKPKRPMVRKQFFITADQNRRLKARARATGQAEADIVRQGVDLALSAEGGTADDWRARMASVLESFGPNEALARRVEKNKKEQAELWRKRQARIRKIFDDK